MKKRKWWKNWRWKRNDWKWDRKMPNFCQKCLKRKSTEIIRQEKLGKNPMKIGRIREKRGKPGKNGENRGKLTCNQPRNCSCIQVCRNGSIPIERCARWWSLPQLATVPIGLQSRSFQVDWLRRGKFDKCSCIATDLREETFHSNRELIDEKCSHWYILLESGVFLKFPSLGSILCSCDSNQNSSCCRVWVVVSLWFFLHRTHSSIQAQCHNGSLVNLGCEVCHGCTVSHQSLYTNLYFHSAENLSLFESLQKDQTYMTLSHLSPSPYLSSRMTLSSLLDSSSTNSSESHRFSIQVANHMLVCGTVWNISRWTGIEISREEISRIFRNRRNF